MPDRALRHRIVHWLDETMPIRLNASNARQGIKTLQYGSITQ